MNESFGERLARLAKEKGLDVSALARASGLKEGSLYVLMRGERKTTNVQAGLLLAEVLGVTPWYLAFGREREAGAVGDVRTSQPPPQEDARLDLIEAQLREVRQNQAEIDRVLKVLEAEAKSRESEKPNPPKESTGG